MDIKKRHLLETALAPRELVMKLGLSPYENPSRIIARKGIRYLNEHVEKDSHFISIMQNRINALLATGYKIQPAHIMVKGRPVVSETDRRLAEFVERVLGNMQGSFEADLMAMMTHISRGFSISEKNWAYIESGRDIGKLGLKSIRFKEQEFFAFEYDAEGHYSLNQVDPGQMRLDLGKFIHFINGFNDENPYGESMAAICAFWVFAKENNAKFWSMFNERFGMPTVKVMTEPNLDAKAEEMVQTLMRDIEEVTAVRVPKGVVLEYLEAMRSGDANYRGYLDYCNSEMSKTVLGSTLTVEAQKNASGSHALGKEHADVMKNNFAFDVVASQSAINHQLIRQIIDYNFGRQEQYPRFEWRAVNTGAFISLAQGVEAMVRCGMKIPVRWMHEILSIPFSEDGEEVLEISSNIMVPVKGLDNKAKEQAGGDKARYAVNETAKEDARINDLIVAEATEELAKRWKAYAETVARSKRFEAEKCAQWGDKNLAGVMTQVLMLAMLRGTETALQEVRKREFVAGGYKPFAEMLEDFRKRKVVSRQEYEQLGEIAKRLGFSISGAMTMRVVQKIKTELDALFAGNTDVPGFHEKVMELFASCGVTGKAGHIETVMRTNIQSQYNDARKGVFDGLNAEEFPYRRVEIIDDDDTREHHRKLAGYTRAIHDPVWGWLKPPFEYNCRCTVRAVYKTEDVVESDWVPDRNEYDFLR